MAAAQKQRWAQRADRLLGWADTADAKAAAIVAALPDYTRDVAFLTQPGLSRERAKITAKERRAYELTERAKQMRDKSANLKAMAARNAGDAEKERQVARDKISSLVAVGDFVSSIYGVRKVLKVNAKSLRIEGMGAPITVDKSLCRKLNLAA